VVTHPHEDHISGMAALMERYRIGEIAEPGMIGPGPGDAAFRQRLAETGRQTRIIAAGDHLTLDGIRMDALWPLPGTVPLRPPDSGAAINNVSIVLDLHYGARRMVLAGDVEEQIDPQLLAEGIAADGRPLDVLKVAHHGSGTATTDAFVEQMHPGVAIVSAGSGNPYGHPSAATVARLQENGARVFRTDLHGSVDISTNGTDLVTRASGGRSKPATPTPPTAPPGVGFCPIPNAPAAAGRQATRARRATGTTGRAPGDGPRAGDGHWSRKPRRGRGRTYNRIDGDPQPLRSRTAPQAARSA
jgi:competence protein ComEC